MPIPPDRDARGQEPDRAAPVRPEAEERLHDRAGERRREDQHGGERVREVELVVEEREQRGQGAAGEVDGAVAGRERRHRPPVDPLPHATEPIRPAASDSIAPPWRSPSPPAPVEADVTAFAVPDPIDAAPRPRSAAPSLVESGEITAKRARRRPPRGRRPESSPRAPAGATSSTPTRSATPPQASPASASAARSPGCSTPRSPLGVGRAGARGRRRARPRRLRPGRAGRPHDRARHSVDALVLVGGRRRRRSAGATRGARRAVGEPRARPRQPAAERPHAGAPRRARRRDRGRARTRSRTRRSAPTRSRRSAWARSPASPRGATTSRA